MGAMLLIHGRLRNEMERIRYSYEGCKNLEFACLEALFWELPSG